MSRFPDPRPLTVAALSWPVGGACGWAEFEAKVRALAAEALARGARFLVWPELFSLEIASGAGGLPMRGRFAAAQEHVPAFRRLFSTLAREHCAVIVAGSIPVAVAPGEYRNRAYVYFPDGAEDFQDKRMVTRIERELFGFSPGERLRVFAAEGFSFGVNVCYDCEFPLLARAQAERGAMLLAAPTRADSRAGDRRLRTGAAARALENQMFVVRSTSVGGDPEAIFLGRSFGSAGVFTPPDVGFPDDGVAAESPADAPGWVVAELDLARIAHVRRHGRALNFADWSRSVAPES